MNHKNNERSQQIETIQEHQLHVVSVTNASTENPHSISIK